MRTNQEQFTEEQTKFIVASIILGLEAMHEKKYMHKDLKPDNVLFDDKGFVRIADFGISEPIMPSDSEQQYIGTPGYRAPEVMLHRPHEASIDYYALGLMAYKCML